MWKTHAFSGDAIVFYVKNSCIFRRWDSLYTMWKSHVFSDDGVPCLLCEKFMRLQAMRFRVCYVKSHMFSGDTTPCLLCAKVMRFHVIPCFLCEKLTRFQETRILVCYVKNDMLFQGTWFLVCYVKNPCVYRRHDSLSAAWKPHASAGDGIPCLLRVKPMSFRAKRFLVCDEKIYVNNNQ